MSKYVFNYNSITTIKSDVNTKNSALFGKTDSFKNSTGGVDIITNAISSISNDIVKYEDAAKKVVKSLETFLGKIEDNENEITSSAPEEFVGHYKNVISDDIFVKILSGASVGELLMSFADFLTTIGKDGVPGADGKYWCCAMPKEYIRYIAEQAGHDFGDDCYIRGNASDLFYYYYEGEESYKRKTGREPDALEKYYMENFQFTDLDSLSYDKDKYSSKLDYCLKEGIIKEGDIIIYNGLYQKTGSYNPFCVNYLVEGHSTVYHDGQIWGQHQKNSGVAFPEALGGREAKGSIVADGKLTGMQVIRYTGSPISNVSNTTNDPNSQNDNEDKQ